MKKFVLQKDILTKRGVHLGRGEELLLKSIDRELPYSMRLETKDGRKFSVPPEIAYRSLRGFPKPPTIRTMAKWHDEGVARSIFGHRVEPDGFGPDGEPSWTLVRGFL